MRVPPENGDLELDKYGSEEVIFPSISGSRLAGNAVFRERRAIRD